MYYIASTSPSEVTTELIPRVEDFISGNSSNSSNSTLDCDYSSHKWLTAKLVLISICGSFVACFGIFGNLTTALILTRPSMRSPNNLYLTALAVFDTCLLITAILIYSVEYIIEFTDNFELYVAWLTYLRFCYAVSHISQTGSVYTTVAVTIERYIAMVHPRRSKVLCTKRGASVSVLAVTCFAILFNCTKFFELAIERVVGCQRFSAFRLAEGPLMRTAHYQVIYTLWLSNIIMVFFPFFTLLALNSVIAWTIRKSYRELDWANRGMGKKRMELKEKSRDATRVLVIIVLIFLLCNFWGFVTTLLERIYGVKYLVETVPRFYAFSREAINFLAIVNSSINFIIYCIFGKDFRKELIIVYGCRSGFSLMLPVEDKFAPWRSFRMRGRKSFQSIRKRTVKTRAASCPNSMLKLNSPALSGGNATHHRHSGTNNHDRNYSEALPHRDQVTMQHNAPNKRQTSLTDPRLWKPYVRFQAESVNGRSETRGLFAKHKKNKKLQDENFRYEIHPKVVAANGDVERGINLLIPARNTNSVSDKTLPGENELSITMTPTSSRGTSPLSFREQENEIQHDPPSKPPSKMEKFRVKFRSIDATTEEEDATSTFSNDSNQVIWL